MAPRVWGEKQFEIVLGRLGMADGGFAVKFDGKIVKYCYAVSMDYDEGTITFNADPPRTLPRSLKEITIVLERERTAAAERKKP